MSLDALRGFDMMLIVGGDKILRAASAAIDPELHSWTVAQTTHPEWNGYSAWDQVFPLFMFVTGVAMPFSLTRRVERGDDRWALFWHVVRRGLFLVLLGAIYNGLLKFEFADQRYPSVLGRIGLGYLFAGLIVLSVGIRGQVIASVLILAGYWAAMRYIPVPGFGAGDWVPGHSLAGYVDRHVIPGRLYREVRDPEGLFSTIPAVATVLSGTFAGHWIRRKSPGGGMKTVALIGAGVATLGLGLLWSRWFPFNKNLWTSSFVLLTSGVSLLTLAVFYVVIDVWGYRRWAFFFVVIGLNAITIYMARKFIDFEELSQLIFASTEKRVHPALFSTAELLLSWLFLYVLYRRRIFLRV